MRNGGILISPVIDKYRNGFCVPIICICCLQPAFTFTVIAVVQYYEQVYAVFAACPFFVQLRKSTKEES